MARGLTSAVKTALAASPTYCHLVYLGFATPVRKTDNSFDIVDDIEGSSQTYNADGTLLGVGHVPESNTPIKHYSLPHLISLIVKAENSKPLSPEKNLC